MKNEQKPDKVKVVASVMAYSPWLVLKVGIAVLRMKRRINRTAKSFEKGMLSRGLPPETAHRLAKSYEADLSIRKMIRRLPGGDFMRTRAM